MTQPPCALRTRERVRERTAWQWLGSGPLSSRRAPASGGARDQRDGETLDPRDDSGGSSQAARVSVYLSICLSAYLSICLSVYLTRVCLAASHEAEEAELATTAEGRVLS